MLSITIFNRRVLIDPPLEPKEVIIILWKVQCKRTIICPSLTLGRSQAPHGDELKLSYTEQVVPVWNLRNVIVLRNVKVFANRGGLIKVSKVIQINSIHDLAVAQELSITNLDSSDVSEGTIRAYFDWCQQVKSVKIEQQIEVGPIKWIIFVLLCTTE